MSRRGGEGFAEFVRNDLYLVIKEAWNETENHKTPGCGIGNAGHDAQYCRKAQAMSQNYPGPSVCEIDFINFEEMNMAKDNWDVDRVEDTAAEFQGAGTSTGFEKVKTIIADKLHSAAEGLGKNGADQDGEFGTATYGKQASEWLDHSAEYVRRFDYKQADAGIREYVKQSPGRSLLIAGVVGLIFGAVLRRR